MRFRTLGPTTMFLAGGTVLVVLLSACSNGEPTLTSAPTTEAVSFNDADVAFVVDAGKHLLTTLTSAQLAEGRSSNPAVLALTQRVIRLKGPEVDKVASWVRSWGRQGADLAHDSAEQAQQERAGGLTPEVMSELSSFRGREFDQLFLSSLSDHLEQGQAIWMSEMEEGTDPGATRLAKKVAHEETALRGSVKRLLLR